VAGEAGKVGLVLIGVQEPGGESSYEGICDRREVWLKALLVCCQVIEE
jgi:hypothetical protein